MRFEFATASRIIFGTGVIEELPALAIGMRGGPPKGGTPNRVLLVTGSSGERARPLVEKLSSAGMRTTHFAIRTEPTTDDVMAGALTAREHECDVVIAFGGGRAIDGAKAIAAMATNPGELLDYLEVIGRGRPLEIPPLPLIAVPTTAGPGTEVTRNAVLLSREHKVKASVRSPLLLPKVAIVDPKLTLTLPHDVTATTGADALTQLIEPFVSVRANPLTDAICRDGIPRAARALPRVCAAPDDLAARTEMSLASLYGGFALANAALGAVHGFAAPIGGMFDAPHGAICAALLPHVVRVNIRVLQARDPNSGALTRYHEVARLLTGNPKASAHDSVAWIESLVRDLGIPRMRAFGIKASDIPEICEKAAVASSMKGNPVALTTEELHEIVDRAL